MDARKCAQNVFELPAESAVYDLFRQFHVFYRPIHTYLSIAICIFATACNVCNIIVLTRKSMRTPVNAILCAIAVCDTTVVVSNFVFSTHWNLVAFRSCHPNHWRYGWAFFLTLHAQISLVGHSTSVWLSVMLALLRYLTLRQRSRASTSISINLSYVFIVCVIAFVGILNIPNCLNYRILPVYISMICPNRTDPGVSPNVTVYIPAISTLALKNDCLVFRMAFWISGALFKMLPCLLLTVLIIMLVRILKEVHERRKRLKRTVEVMGKGTKNRKAPTDRTTKMLVSIVCVFLVTELPQGVMAILSGLFSQEFRENIYNSLGDFLDLLSLINACTTFVIYCSMSELFRQEFRNAFFPRKISQKYSRVKEHRGSEIPEQHLLMRIRAPTIGGAIFNSLTSQIEYSAASHSSAHRPSIENILQEEEEEENENLLEEASSRSPDSGIENNCDRVLSTSVSGETTYL